MCCRYYMEESPELRPFVETARRSGLLNRFLRSEAKSLVTAGEVRPSQIAPVIASDRQGNRSVFPMEWGFHFPKRPLVINARAETADRKPAFQDSWRAHRCILPASYYFEWEHLTRPDGKTVPGAKHLLQTENSHLTWLCGLYRMEEGLPHFVILTAEASGELLALHDRMPVILNSRDAEHWVHPDADPNLILCRRILNPVITRAEEP